MRLKPLTNTVTLKEAVSG